jgi:hypothetical protein
VNGKYESIMKYEYSLKKNHPSWFTFVTWNKLEQETRNPSTRISSNFQEFQASSLHPKASCFFAMFQAIGTKEHEEAIKHEFDLLSEEVRMKHVEKIIAKCLVGRLHCKHNSFCFLHGSV